MWKDKNSRKSLSSTGGIIVFVIFWLVSLSRRHFYEAARLSDEQEQEIELVGVHANGDENGASAASGPDGAVDAMEFTIDDDTEFI